MPIEAVFCSAACMRVEEFIVPDVFLSCVRAIAVYLLCSGVRFAEAKERPRHRPYFRGKTLRTLEQ